MPTSHPDGTVQKVVAYHFLKDVVALQGKIEAELVNNWHVLQIIQNAGMPNEYLVVYTRRDADDTWGNA